MIREFVLCCDMGIEWGEISCLQEYDASCTTINKQYRTRNTQNKKTMTSDHNLG